MESLADNSSLRGVLRTFTFKFKPLSATTALTKCVYIGAGNLLCKGSQDEYFGLLGPPTT